MRPSALECDSAQAAGGGENGRAAASLPPETAYRGNLRLLDEPLTAVFCSNRCSGDLILKTYDLARAMRDAGVPVIGGFQTRMEKECLRLLLRSTQPVVVCPARGIENLRVPRDWRPALDDGRLLVLSRFPATVRRPTADLTAQRNDLVASLATRVFIAHAAPGSKTEAFARMLAASGKPLLTLDSPANGSLVGMGAEVVGQGHAEQSGIQSPNSPRRLCHIALYSPGRRVDRTRKETETG